jgi:hypothetical protein
MAGVLGPGAIEKVKFTVSVRGHQWSSARQVQETLQEFARVIQVRFCQDFFLLREGKGREDGSKDLLQTPVVFFLQLKRII